MNFPKSEIPSNAVQKEMKLFYSLSNEMAETSAPLIRVAKGGRWVPADNIHTQRERRKNEGEHNKCTGLDSPHSVMVNILQI